MAFDLTAYLERIGLCSGRPDLAAVHRAHTTAITFENLESSNGRPVDLDVDQLVDKMVVRGRGGYCFEQNMLFKAAVEAMGLGPVELMLARVRVGRTGDDRPLNHLLLRITEGGRQWLADVGLGGGGLLDPIPFEVGVESDQFGWVYRLVEDGPELVVQVFNDGAWTDLYGFVPVPVPVIDVEVSNWYTSTHPLSPFRTGGFFGRRSIDCCLSLFVFEQAVLVERSVGGASQVTEVPRTQVPRLLSERFAIEGVTLKPDGRLDFTQPPAR